MALRSEVVPGAGVSGELSVKHAAARASLQRAGRVVVAFSGGVDSAVLAALAHEELGREALIATARSPAVARREMSDAARIARSSGWNHVIVDTHEGTREEYVRNEADRCYWCKTELFEVLGPIAAERDAVVAVGTNADDLGDYRPGLRAAAEANVITPLADAGLTKSDVRALAATYGLDIADKPASPCLASRFAYGVRVTPEGLQRIDEAEEFLRSLGFSNLRVRDHGDMARIEVAGEDIERAAAAHAEIEGELRRLGFRYVTLDLSGFRSGSLNEVLPPTIRRARTERSDK